MKKILKGIGIAVIVLIAIGVMVGKNESKGSKEATTTAKVETKKEETKKTETKKEESKKEEPKEEVLQVSALDVITNYENEAKGNQMYKGKILLVEGVVNSVGQSVGQYYVTVGSGKEFELTSVQCYISKEQESLMAELAKGQNIKIQGKCDGKSLNIALKNGKIVK